MFRVCFGRFCYILKVVQADIRQRDSEGTRTQTFHESPVPRTNFAHILDGHFEV